ncbi:delta-60 repeat domain-containing protein [Pseudomonas sp. R1-7]|uniref:delta-60 repeat domain-containing protein n=1 Tax=Pseudomonas sp. R1-7 TaxID=2817398 RepID=UPI003DA90691
MAINSTSTRAGELDPDFNNGEFLYLPGSYTSDIAIDPKTNKIYIAGRAGEGPIENPRNYMILALNPDGTRDKDFNGGAPIITSFFYGFGSSAEKILILDDGKILVLGTVRSNRSDGLSFALARYHRDGTLDDSFGSNGHAVPSHELADEKFMLEGDVPFSLALCESRIYITGQSAGATMLMGLEENGSIAMDFGDNGVRIINSRSLGSMVIANNRIYLTGAVWARLHLTGDLDLDFGTDGFVDPVHTAPHGVLSATYLQNNSNILGVGYASSRNALLTSIDRDGGRNEDFNEGGPVLAPPEHSASSWTDCVIKNSRIITAGAAKNGQLLSIGRYLQDGKPDTDFGDNGWKDFTLRGSKPVNSRPALAVQHNNAVLVTSRFLSSPFILQLRG